MGMVDAGYDSDTPESTWNQVKKVLLGRKKEEPDITKDRRNENQIARYKVGDIVRGPDWETKLKVKEVKLIGKIWKYKLTKVDDGEDYAKGDWQEEDQLHPEF
jgi:hypothetical protein